MKKCLTFVFILLLTACGNGENLVQVDCEAIYEGLGPESIHASATYNGLDTAKDYHYCLHRMSEKSQSELLIIDAAIFPEIVVNKGARLRIKGTGYILGAAAGTTYIHLKELAELEVME